MATTWMNPIDAAFLLGESGSNLMHVAGLEILRAPPDADGDFARRFLDNARCYTTAVEPFDRRSPAGLLNQLLPRWEIVKEIDLEYHLQHHALPRPGGPRELGTLVSRLHSIRMDQAYPLWEYHLIEGLHDGRTAVYTKVHHALLDGIAAIRLARQAMSPDPEERDRPPMWAYRTTRRRRSQDTEEESVDWLTALMRQLLAPVKGAQAQLGGVQGLARMFGGLDLPRLRRTAGELARPYEAPRSILNGPISPHRRVATQSYEMSRIRSLAETAGGTVNDVILAICGGGLRRYLEDIDELPEEALIAGMPMSFHPEDSDETSGNATTMALVSLATDVSDVRERFAAVVASAAQAKEHMSRLPRAAIMSYTALLFAPFAVGLVTDLSTRVRPMFNVVVSNVPGPSNPLYLDGARLEEWYPVSIPLAGQALNITVLSYVDRMNFCFTACRTTLPHIQRLAPYCGEALTELEKAFAE